MAGRAVEDLAPEQGGGEIGDEFCRSATMIEERVEFDEIERCDAAAFVEQFHDQMGFAEGCAARHRGPDSGGDGWVEKVDVETDVEHGAFGLHFVDELLQWADHADLIEHAHVIDQHALVLKPVALVMIDAADADHVHVGGVDRMSQGRFIQSRQFRMAAKGGDRHAWMLPVSEVVGMLKSG